VVLINLLEQITCKSIGRYNKIPKVRFQRLENAMIATNFLKLEGFKLVGIQSEDIVDGKPALICGLIWMLIVRYHVQKYFANAAAKTTLLAWVQKQIQEYNIVNFTSDWRNGKAVCALIKTIEPGCIDISSIDTNSPLENAQLAKAAAARLGLPTILRPEDLISPHADELSVVAYIWYFRNQEHRKLHTANGGEDEDENLM